MKNYYEILGLSVNATEAQVKYVFRRLAITYHPDKNPSPEAEAIFKEVNEAYEVLGDPVKRTQYDYLLLTGNKPTVVEDSQRVRHRDPAYRRRGPTYQRRSGPSPQLIMMESFLKYVKILSWIGCMVCFVLLFDFFLLPNVMEEKVVSPIRLDKRFAFRYRSDLLLTSGGHHFNIDVHELKYFPDDSKISILKSPLLSLLIKVENFDHSYQVNNLATVYRNLMFGPILLLALSLAGLLLKAGTEMRFNLGIVLILMFMLNIGFFIWSRI
jgi:curved DNA-binding protein CbpA